MFERLKKLRQAVPKTTSPILELRIIAIFIVGLTVTGVNKKRLLFSHYAFACYSQATISN